MITSGRAARSARASERQPSVGATRVRQHFAYLALGFRIEVANDDIMAHQGAASCPPRADDSSSEKADGSDLLHAIPPLHVASLLRRCLCLQLRFFNFSFVRTSSGPITRTFIASRIVTARSTKLPLDARTPLER